MSESEALGADFRGALENIPVPSYVIDREVPHPDLTPRQAEVLRLLGQGRSTQQIADDLHLTTKTVRNYVETVLRVMGVHSRIEAVAAARRCARTTE